MQPSRFALAVLTSLILVSPAHATLMELNDPSLPASPDGFNITRDPETGLDWLDLTVTAGISFDDIRANELAPGGSLEGFRHATQLELTGWTPSGQIESLFINFGFGSTFSFIGGYPLVRDFLAALGCRGSCAGYGYIMGIFLENGDPDDPGWSKIEAFQSTSGNDFGSLDLASQDALVSRPVNGSDSTSGHFLVRPIPEPSTGLLVGLGLLSARVWRLKRRAAG